MSATAVQLNKLELNKPKDIPQAAVLDTSAGAVLDFDGQDTKILVLLEGTGTVVVKAGNGPMSAGNDLSVTVGANGTALELESALYKQCSGPNKGKVVLTGPNSAKVRTVLLR